MIQTRTIPLEHMRYVENRIRGAIIAAVCADEIYIHPEPDPTDAWLGWRLTVGRNGSASVRVDGLHAIDDVLDALQAGGWVRVE